jgi:transposase
VGAQDEATFGLIPLVSRGWARKGIRPIAKINHKNECTNVIAARSAKSFVYIFSRKKGRREFVKFLEKLRLRWKRFILFTDNYKPHSGGIVKDYLKRHSKTVKLEYFPKYSPELNPTEPCWKLGRKALSNRLIKTLPAAKYHLRKAFDKSKDMPKMFQYLRD